MQRNNDREQRLQEWSNQLELKQRQLEASVRSFRDEVAAQTSKLMSLQQELTERAATVQQREAAVAQREASLLETLRGLVSSSKAELEQLNDDDDDGSDGSDHPLMAHGKEAEDDEPSPQRKSRAHHVDPSGEGDAEEDTSARALAVFPKLSVPVLPLSQLMRRSQDPAAATVTPPRGSAKKSPRSVSPALYEGIVDRNQPSHVEDIPDEDSTPTPRGLRSSPQFRPMDPNDSGLGFFRRRMSTTFDQVRPTDEDEELQELFDEAVEFLITSGMVPEEDLENWLAEGVTAEEIIAYYRRVAMGGAREEDEGAEEEGEAADDDAGENDYDVDDEPQYDDEYDEPGQQQEEGDPDVEESGRPNRQSPQKAPQYNDFDDDEDDETF